VSPVSDAVDGAGLRIAIVVSRFNEPITERLEAGARSLLVDSGVDVEDLTVVRVPGAWELPLAVHLLLSRGGLDGVVALGCVIRGQTPHFEYVTQGAVTGLEAVSRAFGIPVGFGVLTTDDAEQAWDRAGGSRGNKGEEAARATLEMCRLAARLR
jgi:6,7-dimethyl-8-ribityllumazine synthase